MDYVIAERIALFPELEASQDFIFPKKDKPDLEAMTVYKSEIGPVLLIFGSGTKSPTTAIPEAEGIATSVCRFCSENWNVEEVGTITEVELKFGWMQS
jgi:hypothetical protein